jgi:hypothetical protein
MQIDRKVVEQALDYIDKVDYGPYDNRSIITALKAALAQPEDKSQAAFEHWVETVEATQGCAISRNAVADELLTVTPAQVAHAEAVENLTVKESLTVEPCNKSCAPGYCYCEPIIKPEIKGHNVEPEQAEPVADAMKTVIKAMQADPDYAWSWHCNVAMAFADAGGDPYTANQGAARFMRLLANVDPAHELPPHPPRREWRSLEDTERAAVQFESFKRGLTPLEFMELHEAKLKELNHD